MRAPGKTTVNELVGYVNNCISIIFLSNVKVDREYLLQELTQIVPPLLPSWLAFRSYEVIIPKKGDLATREPFLFLRIAKDKDQIISAEFCLSFRYEPLRDSPLSRAKFESVRTE